MSIPSLYDYAENFMQLEIKNKIFEKNKLILSFGGI